MIKQLTPYLNFNGTAAKAIAFYERALDAKTDGLMRVGDIPGEKPPSPETKDRVIHARLVIGDGVIMISDTMPGMPVPAGNNVHVCLDFDDAADQKKKFDALSKDGQVTMPLQDTFLGATFGTLVDAFGIPWMFYCMKQK